jgi:hypothetical protein
MFVYGSNPTSRMLEHLRKLAPDSMAKLECFDGETRTLDTGLIKTPPDFCFIDGEHTRDAVRADFEFCLRVAAADAVIAFHDDWIVAPEIAQICRNLKKQGRGFSALKLHGVMFAICLGNEAPVARDARVRKLAWTGYWGLKQLALRRFVERWFPARLRPWMRSVGKRILNPQSNRSRKDA